MSEQAPGRATLREKAVEQFKEMWALTAYLYVIIASVGLFKAATLQQVGISYSVWGTAIVKALILAKFMLFARDLHLGKRFRDKPLIWPTLYIALVYLVFLLILMTIEELVLGAIHHRTLAESLGRVAGTTLLQAFAVCLLGYLILIPYSAFMCLGEVLGEGELIRMFFGSRSPRPLRSPAR